MSMTHTQSIGLENVAKNTMLTVADLPARPPSDQIFLDLMQFTGNLNKIAKPHPPPALLRKSWIRHWLALPTMEYLIRPAHTT